MTTCKRGHDLAKVGKDKRDQCKACRAEDRKAARRRACQASHPFYDCEPFTNAQGAQLCRRKIDKVALGNRDRRVQQRIEDARKQDIIRRDLQVTDGWEDEFGPVPPRDPDLVDWVEALRAAETTAERLRDVPWYRMLENRSEGHTDRLRTSSEGHVGSAYQPPGKRPVAVLARRA